MPTFLHFRKVSIALISVFSAYFVPVPVSAFDTVNSQSQSKERFVEVSGVGTVYAVPDEIMVVLGVKSWNKDIRTCYKENQSIVEQVLTVARKHKISADRIQTSEISVEPTYPSSNSYDRNCKPDGYRVEKRITLVSKDLTSVPLLLTDAIENGANLVGQVDLRIENPRKSKDEARSLALRSAQEKASAMASQMNCKIGPALIIKESGSNVTGLISLNGYSQNNRSVNMFQVDPTTIVDSRDEVIQGDLAKGRMRVTSAVTVKFELTD